MTAHILDGKKIAQGMKEAMALEVRSLNIRPKLVVILVGDHPASHLYVKNKQTACAAVGIESQVLHFDKKITQESLTFHIVRLNQDPLVHGILIQLPLPQHLNANAILSCVNPLKDVDGLTPYNLGLLFSGRPGLMPCTPQGCLHLIHEALPSCEGVRITVVGRSVLVGRSLACLLTMEGATVTLAHSKTQDLKEITRQSRVVVCATGQGNFFDASYFAPQTILIDVGINRTPECKLTGDIDFESCLPHAAAITPVPGGVGPMTIAYLLKNTIQAAFGELG